MNVVCFYSWKEAESIWSFPHWPDNSSHFCNIRPYLLCNTEAKTTTRILFILGRGHSFLRVKIFSGTLPRSSEWSDNFRAHMFLFSREKNKGWWIWKVAVQTWQQGLTCKDIGSKNCAGYGSAVWSQVLFFIFAKRFYGRIIEEKKFYVLSPPAFCKNSSYRFFGFISRCNFSLDWLRG